MLDKFNLFHTELFKQAIKHNAPVEKVVHRKHPFQFQSPYGSVYDCAAGYYVKLVSKSRPPFYVPIDRWHYLHGMVWKC